MEKSKKHLDGFNHDQSIPKCERKKLERELVRAEKLFKTLSSKDFLTEFEMNLNNAKTENDMEEIIKKTVSLITKQIKQMKIKNEIGSITLIIKSYEYPFPPKIIIGSGSEEFEMETELIKPKELHYEFDAISADYNLIHGNNRDVILDTYNKILTRLNQYNWKTTYKTSEEFEIKLVVP